MAAGHPQGDMSGNEGVNSESDPPSRCAAMA